MKKQEHLFEAIGLVEDRYVEEAADARRTATPWKKWGALAACLVLVIGLGASSLMLMFRGCGSDSTTADNAQSATASDVTDGSDSAAITEDTAGTPETDSSMEESATADSTIPNDGHTGTDNGEMVQELPAFGVLSADADGLTASRTVTVAAEKNSETGENQLVILDSYRVSADEDVHTVLHYAAPAEEASYAATVDHVEQTMTEDAGILSFPLTLTAGDEVTVEVTVILPARNDGVAGFSLATTSGNVALTEQSAALELESWGEIQILENSFEETDGTVLLEPSQTYRLELRFLP